MKCFVDITFFKDYLFNKNCRWKEIKNRYLHDSEMISDKRILLDPRSLPSSFKKK